MLRLSLAVVFAMSAAVMPAPAYAADVDVAYVQPVHRVAPAPHVIHAPRHGWAYVVPAPVVMAAPRCYRTRVLRPSGSVVYRRVCF